MNVSPLNNAASMTGVGEAQRPVAPLGAEARPSSAPRAAPVPREAQPGLVERLRSAAQQIESFVRSQSRNLEFRVDDSTGVVVVRVRDAGTGEVIRQIPSEAALRVAERIASAAPGAGPASVMLDEVV